MNYGWLTPDSSDLEVQSVVLHDFGHALGLIHEHQNPNGGIPWDREAVIEELSGPPNSWSLDTIEQNMFKSYSMSDVTSTTVDANSIMMYMIPRSWTGGRFEAGQNDDLSETDKEFIQGAYPF
jgi:hypothetical protein